MRPTTLLTINLAQFNALGSVTLTASDLVTPSPIPAPQIPPGPTPDRHASPPAGHRTFVRRHQRRDLLQDREQYNEIVTDNIALTAGDTVTLADSGPTLSFAEAATQINALVNVDAADATYQIHADHRRRSSSTRSWARALRSPWGDARRSPRPPRAHLATLDFSTLAAANVDQLDSTPRRSRRSRLTNLTALGTVFVGAAVAATLTGTGAYIAAVFSTRSSSAHGVDKLDAQRQHADDLRKRSSGVCAGHDHAHRRGHRHDLRSRRPTSSACPGICCRRSPPSALDFSTPRRRSPSPSTTSSISVPSCSRPVERVRHPGRHSARHRRRRQFHAPSARMASTRSMPPTTTLTMNATQYGELGVVHADRRPTPSRSPTRRCIWPPQPFSGPWLRRISTS